MHSYIVPASRRFARTQRPMRALRVVFAARVVGGELTREIDGSTDESRWFDLADVAALPQVGLVEIALDMWRACTPSRDRVRAGCAG